MSIALRLSLAAALVLAWEITPEPLQAQTYQCVTATDGFGSSLQQRVVQVVTGGNDSLSNATRTAYNLPQTTASKVTFVTQTNTCATAAQHYYTSMGKTPVPSDVIRVIVLKVGNTRYVVSVTQPLLDGVGGTLIFDSNWVNVAGVAS